MAHKKTPSLEEYRAPWETDDAGQVLAPEDQEVDRERLKKYIHGILVDRDQARDGRDTAERAAREAQAQLDSKAREGETADQARQREVDALRKKAEDGDQATAKLLRYEACAKAELPLAHAGRLQGKDLDELVADAKSLKKDLRGGGTEGDGRETDEEAGSSGPRVRPGLLNPGDPNPNAKAPVKRDAEWFEQTFPYDA